MNRRQVEERGMHVVFFCVAFASIGILSMISVFLFAEGLPIFEQVSVKDFLFGEFWYPTSDPHSTATRS